MRRLRSLASGAGLALLAACAAVPPLPDEAQQVAEMLANFERLAAAKADEQKSAFIAAAAAYEQKPNDATRLNLALHLLLPRAPWQDATRAQTLLGGVEATPGKLASPRRDLAQLLHGMLADRLRLQRDDQRRLDQLAQQLREEKRKTEEAQQKLDSLRAIDRDLRRRGKER